MTMIRYKYVFTETQSLTKKKLTEVAFLQVSLILVGAYKMYYQLRCQQKTQCL